ncbi:farnesol dehydrogenase-like [Osmia lignaria lignaria]|uniref:farnesol dehydrogenase-like n=1 Tax=Osmia lignaria lignaria TaxID=1437193 RepID=UPI0014793F33|nr:farnesol dehydrogenase-like [Osmia lignaria]
MNQWCGKIAAVTGASSGIGKATSIALLKHGVNVVGLARRLETMKKIPNEVEGIKGKFYPIQCDLSKEEDIIKAFKFVETLGGADILVNNAGLGYVESITESSTEHMKNVLDLNVLASAICAREITQSLRKRKARGQIINVNSVLGHNAALISKPCSLYETSKYAITGMSETLRKDMQQSKAPIKVTSLSPGIVKTDLSLLQDAGGETFFDAVSHIYSEDIADGIIYVLTTPPHVQVNELTITALHSGIIPTEKIKL